MCFLLGAFWLHDTNNYMMSYFIFCPIMKSHISQNVGSDFV